MLPSQKILLYVQVPKKAFRNWMLPMAWFEFFTNRHFYEIVFIKKFPHNFECWNRPMPLLFPSHSSSRNAPPPVPLLLPSHSSSRPILSPVPRCKQTLWASGCSFICLKSTNDRFQTDECLLWTSRCSFMCLKSTNGRFQNDKCLRCASGWSFISLKSINDRFQRDNWTW